MTTCECADPVCPQHTGASKCTESGCTTLYRSDMADESGTRMCGNCAADAMESGLFFLPETHDVLCQCGWGQLACPEPELPDNCPVCGYDFTPHREALEEA